MADPLLPDDGAILLLHQQLRDPTCSDRAAKFQVFAEQVWGRLRHHIPLADAVVNNFVAMLRIPDNIQLAQLVIPDLRPNALPPVSKQQCDVLSRIELRPPGLEHVETKPTGFISVAQSLYEDEKRILEDADWHRACLLLYGRADVTSTQSERVRQWLALCSREHSS